LGMSLNTMIEVNEHIEKGDEEWFILKIFMQMKY
jgi:hypothetical protein